MGEPARPAVAEVDQAGTAHALAHGIHLLVGHVPDHHGIGAEAQFVMAHDDAETLDHALLLQARQAREHVPLVEAEGLRELGVGMGHQRQAVLDGGNQRMVPGVRHEGLGRWRWRVSLHGRGQPATQVEAQINVVVPLHRQAQHAHPDLRLDATQRPLQGGGVGRGGDEPEVEAVLPLVVVVDLGTGTDAGGHLRQAILRHARRRQHGGADTVRTEHGADAADHAFPAQAAQRVQHGLDGPSQSLGHGVEGSRGEGKIPLEVVEQGQGKIAHSPIRLARWVKKMPLGLAAGRLARGSKLWPS